MHGCLALRASEAATLAIAPSSTRTAACKSALPAADVSSQQGALLRPGSHLFLEQRCTAASAADVTGTPSHLYWPTSWKHFVAYNMTPTPYCLETRQGSLASGLRLLTPCFRAAAPFSTARTAVTSEQQHCCSPGPLHLLCPTGKGIATEPSGHSAGQLQGRRAAQSSARACRRLRRPAPRALSARGAGGAPGLQLSQGGAGGRAEKTRARRGPPRLCAGGGGNPAGREGGALSHYKQGERARAARALCASARRAAPPGPPGPAQRVWGRRGALAFRGPVGGRRRPSRRGRRPRAAAASVCLVFLDAWRAAHGARRPAQMCRVAPAAPAWPPRPPGARRRPPTPRSRARALTRARRRARRRRRRAAARGA